MHLHDGPTFRFLAGLADRFSRPRYSDADFLRAQYAALEAHVERFPPDQRDSRALAWIEANASRYRHQWQARVATGERH